MNISLKGVIDMVNDFNELIVGRPRGCSLLSSHTGSSYLHDVSAVIEEESVKLLEYAKASGDGRALRAHLIAEEFAEFIRASASCDEVLTLDALGDLLYVVLGSAAEMDLPLDTAFFEIHRSNMSKRKKSEDPDGIRVRDKGPNYSPPNLKSVLDGYRRSVPPVQ